VVEVHLLDARPQLYGRNIEVQFLRWLRGQKRFASTQALARQIGRDVEEARRALAQPIGDGKSPSEQPPGRAPSPED
jgi:riboflavin kinase/FMN adenylyltransferase